MTNQINSYRSSGRASLPYQFSGRFVVWIFKYICFEDRVYVAHSRQPREILSRFGVNVCEREIGKRGRQSGSASIKSARIRCLLISSTLTLKGDVPEAESTRLVFPSFAKSHQHETELRRSELQSRNHSGSHRLLRVARQLVGRNFLASGRFHAGVHDRARPYRRTSAALQEKKRQASRSFRRQSEGSHRLGQRHQILLPRHSRGIPVSHNRRWRPKLGRETRHDRRVEQRRSGTRRNCSFSLHRQSRPSTAPEHAVPDFHRSQCRRNSSRYRLSAARGPQAANRYAG